MKRMSMVLALALAAAGMYAANGTASRTTALKAPCTAPDGECNNWMDVVRYRGPAAKLVGQRVYGYVNVNNSDANAVSKDGNTCVVVGWAGFSWAVVSNAMPTTFIASPHPKGPMDGERETLRIEACIQGPLLNVKATAFNPFYVTGTIVVATDRRKPEPSHLAGDFTRDIRVAADSFLWLDAAHHQLTSMPTK